MMSSHMLILTLHLFIIIKTCVILRAVQRLYETFGFVCLSVLDFIVNLISLLSQFFYWSYTTYYIHYMMLAFI